jgi:adenylate cyclase
MSWLVSPKIQGTTWCHNRWFLKTTQALAYVGPLNGSYGLPIPLGAYCHQQAEAVSRLKHLIQEIHRRSLWQVLGIYVGGAWVALQGIEALVSVLSLPEWIPAFALVLLIVGLPIVLATAFVREGAEEEETSGEAETGTGLRRLWVVLATTGSVLVLLAIAAWVTWPRPLGLLIDVAGVSGPPVDPSLPEKPSIAVLPFENMSADPEQEYFADGITEDLTTELARIQHLFVISRNSAFTYKGKPVKVEDVGRELGVRYVLEGSVRKAGDHVRITAQLIDATTGGHLWSERYDRDLSEIFVLQSEIAEEVLIAVDLEIQAAERQRLSRKSSEELTTVDALWKGFYHLNRLTRKDNEEARRLFERVLDLDPGHADAHAHLGNTYLVEFAHGWSSDAKLLDMAEELARRAIALDDSQPGGHQVMGWVHLSRGNLSEATAAAERVIALTPNSEYGHAVRGLALARGGRFLEASGAMRRALRLNPRAPSTLLGFVAFVNFAAGRTEKAVEQLERVRMANPDNINSRTVLAAYYGREGQTGKASAAVAEILRINPDFSVARARELYAGWEDAIGPQEFAAYREALGKAGLPE